MTKKTEQDIEQEQETESQEVETNEAEESLDIEAQLLAAQQSAKDNWDKVLRAQAEMENLKRRSAKDIESAHKLSLIHIWRCRRSTLCRSRWSPYH